MIYMTDICIGSCEKLGFENSMGEFGEIDQTAQSRILTISLITSNSLTRVRPSSSANSQSWCKYCWWTKSCTTKDDDYPIIYRVLTIPGGAGFCPSTVCWTCSKCWKSGEKVIFCFTWSKNSLTYLGSSRSYIGQWRYLLPMRGTRGWSKSASLTNHLLRRGSYTSKTSTKNPGLCQSSDVGSNTSAAEDLRTDLWRKIIYYSGQHLGIASGYQN